MQRNSTSVTYPLEKTSEEVKNAVNHIFEVGMDQQQVQLALKHLFQPHENVYVPSVADLAGEGSYLPLAALKNVGFEYVAFSLNANNRHQVGVWVDLKGVAPKIKVYDSLPQSELSPSARQQLASLLNITSDIDMQMSEPPFEYQQDKWSCGVRVIAHLLHVYANPSSKSEKNILLATELAHQYYIAYAKQKEKEEIEQQKAEKNAELNRGLLEIIEFARGQAGIYGENDPLQRLADLLQFIVWGNLNRQKTTDDSATRVNNSLEYKRTQSFLHTLEEYKKTKQEVKKAKQEEKKTQQEEKKTQQEEEKAIGEERLGQLILQIGSFYANQNIEEIKNIIKRALEISAAYRQANSNFVDKKSKDHAALLKSELGLILNVKSSDESRTLLKILLDLLLKSKSSPQEIVCEFMKLVECDSSYFNVVVGNDFILYQILEQVSERLFYLDEDIRSEKNRITNEQLARKQEHQRKVDDARLILQKYDIQVDESVCLVLANNRFHLEFLEKYSGYLPSLSSSERSELVINLCKFRITDIANILFCIPKKMRVAYLRDHKNEMNTLDICIEIVKKLGQDYDKDLLEFYKQHLVSLRFDANKIAEFMLYLREEDRLSIAMSIQAGVHTSDLIPMISVLKKEEQSGFIAIILNGTKSISTIVKLLSFLNEQERSVHLKNIDKLIYDLEDLVKVLSLIKNEERLAYIIELKKNYPSHRIFSKSEIHWSIASLLSIIPPKDQFELMVTILLGKKLETIDELIKLLGSPNFSITARLAFAIQHRDLIKDLNDLFLVLLQLQPNEYVSLLQAVEDKVEHSKKLKELISQFLANSTKSVKSYVLIQILKLMPGGDSLCIAEESARFHIPRDDEFVEVLSLLPPINRRSYINTCEAQIHEAYISCPNIVEILHLLSPEERASFFKNMVTHRYDYNNILEIVELMPIGSRFEYINLIEKSNIKTKYVIRILKMLSGRDEELSKLLHSEHFNIPCNKIEKAITTLGLLPVVHRLAYANKIIRSVTRYNLSNIITILRNLREEDRLSFIKQRLVMWLINTVADLSLIVNEVNQKDGAILINDMPHLAKNRDGFLVLLKLLQGSERLQYFKKHKERLLLDSLLSVDHNFRSQLDQLLPQDASLAENMDLDVITSALIITVNSLPPSQRLSYLQAHQVDINDMTLLYVLIKSYKNDNEGKWAFFQSSPAKGSHQMWMELIDDVLNRFVSQYASATSDESILFCSSRCQLLEEKLKVHLQKELYQACKTPDLVRIGRLLAVGADLNKIEEKDKSPLICLSRHSELAKKVDEAIVAANNSKSSEERYLTMLQTTLKNIGSTYPQNNDHSSQSTKLNRMKLFTRIFENRIQAQENLRYLQMR